MKTHLIFVCSAFRIIARAFIKAFSVPKYVTTSTQMGTTSPYGMQRTSRPAILIVGHGFIP